MPLALSYNSFSLIFLLTASVLVGSCKHKKLPQAPAFAPADTALRGAVGAPGSRPKFVEVPANLLAKFDQPYATCTGRAGITYADANQTIPATINYKVRHGQAISFTASVFLGIVAAQGLIRPDSFFILNKLQNQLIYGATDRMASMVGGQLSLTMAEGLLTGCYAYPDGMHVLAASDSSLLGLMGPDIANADTASLLIRPGETAPRQMVYGGKAQRAELTNTDFATFYPGTQRRLPGRTTLTAIQAETVAASIKLDHQQRSFDVSLPALKKPETNARTTLQLVR